MDAFQIAADSTATSVTNGTAADVTIPNNSAGVKARRCALFADGSGVTFRLDGAEVYATGRAKGCPIPIDQLVVIHTAGHAHVRLFGDPTSTRVVTVVPLDNQ